MGISLVTALRLIDLIGTLPDRGYLLTLGRQNLKLGRRPGQQAAVKERLVAAGFDCEPSDLVQDDTYADTFFKVLGFDSVAVMDVSDFEAADILQDLNAPIPPELEGRFDMIFDGGTTEHVIDVTTCLGNIFHMLAPGGLFVSVVPANNWFAHGFYQFSHDLVYAYWRDGCGCDVIDCVAIPNRPGMETISLPDPAGRGRRKDVQALLPDVPTLMFYAVRKGPEAHPFTRAMQTVYEKSWAMRPRVPTIDADASQQPVSAE